MTKTGEQAAKEAPETAQVLLMADYKPEIGPANIPALPQRPVPGGREGLIAGRGRVLAAKQLGLDEVPVVVARGWSEAQKRAYVIADNKLTENGGWDDALLAAAMADLKRWTSTSRCPGSRSTTSRPKRATASRTRRTRSTRSSSASSSSARTRRTSKRYSKNWLARATRCE